MHLTWNPWPQLGIIRMASPSAKSKRQIAHSVAPTTRRPSLVENTTTEMASHCGTTEFLAVSFSKIELGCQSRFRGQRWKRIGAPAVELSARAKGRAEIMIPCFYRSFLLCQMVPTSMTSAPPVTLLKA
ncbi:hypothetical protein KFK09_001691 [Dendrobium nobile]|uniref:Uncharacterized protein n=1 Tax=Dendrobium nobile TaxID=94219 RepID=A0A8T3C8X1_DENNO|nr:hypothetical protein KFK09_001691 [Dendrobium nobile]